MYLHLFFSFHFCFCVAVKDTCLIWQFTFLVFFGFFICKRLAALDTIELELIQCINYDSDYFDWYIFTIAKWTQRRILITGFYACITKKFFTLAALLRFPNYA